MITVNIPCFLEDFNQFWYQRNNFQKENNTYLVIMALERKKRFECNDCDTAYAEKRSLNRHLATHHMENPPHRCEVCGKAFYYERDLRMHAPSHSEERPWKCTMCNKSYKSKYYSRYHHLFIHGECEPVRDESSKLKVHLHEHPGSGSESEFSNNVILYPRDSLKNFSVVEKPLHLEAMFKQTGITASFSGAHSTVASQICSNEGRRRFGTESPDGSSLENFPAVEKSLHKTDCESVIKQTGVTE